MSEHPPDNEKPDAAMVERLRAAFREEGPSAGEPVDADKVWRAVAGESPPEERREVVERVAADPAWATAWRLAQALTQAAAGAASSPGVEPPLAVEARARSRSTESKPVGRRFRFAWSRPVWAAAAAAALVLVVVGVSLREDSRDTSGRLRGGDAAAIASQVTEGGPLSRERFVLRWSAGPEGTRWTLQVSSEDLRVSHRADRLERSEYQVPASVLAPLPAGARVLWQVEERLPDGRVRRSTTFVNRIE